MIAPLRNRAERFFNQGRYATSVILGARIAITYPMTVRYRDLLAPLDCLIDLLITKIVGKGCLLLLLLDDQCSRFVFVDVEGMFSNTLL